MERLPSLLADETKLDERLTPELMSFVNDFLRLQQLYNSGIREVRTKLEILDDEFRVQFGHNPIHHMESRLKSPASILDKMHRKNVTVSVENIRRCLTDIAGVRVICNYVDDVYRICDLLARQDDITLMRTKDYIASPKENGYRSLHIVVSVPVFLAESTEPVPVEIQIRTIQMDFWASLEHQLKYKNPDHIPQSLRDRLFECAVRSNALDLEMQNIYKEISAAAPEK